MAHTGRERNEDAIVPFTKCSQQAVKMELTENKSVLRVHSKQMMILYTMDFNLNEMEVYKRAW